jgi:hypothetical protein
MQRPQQNGIDHRKNSYIRADPQCERQNGHCSETGTSRKQGERIMHVLIDLGKKSAQRRR